jgi:hypothetical protein
MPEKEEKRGQTTKGKTLATASAFRERKKGKRNKRNRISLLEN